MDPRIQNYMKRMSHFKAGHPITDPDNFTHGDARNQVCVGDVGFFQRSVPYRYPQQRCERCWYPRNNHTWMRIFNVFEDRDGPEGWTPWNRALPEYETYSPNNIYDGLISKDYAHFGISIDASL